jgi:hypothetical protein
VAWYEADRPVPAEPEPTLSNLTAWAAWQTGHDRLVDRYRVWETSCTPFVDPVSGCVPGMSVGSSRCGW